MELQTVFKRESVADPFSVGIIKHLFTCLNLIVAYPMFRTRIENARAGKPVPNQSSV
jgi:hypothetical protein